LVKPQLILASSSPRRFEMLQAHGHQVEVLAPDVDEYLDSQIKLSSLPAELEGLALRKARYVVQQLQRQTSRPMDRLALVIGADTVVYADEVLGKPADYQDALSTLLKLRNRTHLVMTAVALIELPALVEKTFTDTATVRFADYSMAEIDEYLHTDEPHDKAGSYAIQGAWGAQVVELVGDIETVIGLPYRRLKDYTGLLG